MCLKAKFFCARALVAISTLASAAQAEGTRVAVDLDYASAIGENEVGAGTGASLRLGQKLDLPRRLALTPEVGGSFHAFSGAGEAGILSGFFGARLGFGMAGLEPSAFAHFGIGKLTGPNSDPAGRQSPGTGATLDGGLALALTVLPYLDVGAHVAYANLFLDDGQNFAWLRAGLDGALKF